MCIEDVRKFYKFQISKRRITLSGTQSFAQTFIDFVKDEPKLDKGYLISQRPPYFPCGFGVTSFHYCHMSPSHTGQSKEKNWNGCTGCPFIILGRAAPECVPVYVCRQRYVLAGCFVYTCCKARNVCNAHYDCRFVLQVLY